MEKGDIGYLKCVQEHTGKQAWSWNAHLDLYVLIHGVFILSITLTLRYFNTRMCCFSIANYSVIPHQLWDKIIILTLAKVYLSIWPLSSFPTSSFPSSPHIPPVPNIWLHNFRIKLNFQKTKIMASSPITSWQINGETMKTVRNFIFLGSKITADGNWQPWN